MSFGAALSGFADGFRSGESIKANRRRDDMLERVMERTRDLDAQRQADYAPVPPNGGAGGGTVQPIAAWEGPVPVDFGQYESQYGLPSGYLQRTAQLESNMGRNMKNPNSSATGPFQFIDSTARQYGLTDRMDWGQSTDAASRLARDNAAHLRRTLGRDPTAAELYLAHQQGAGGAAKLLASPNARAVDIVGADAVRLNGGDPNMTASEFANKWLGKFGDPTPTRQADPAPQQAQVPAPQRPPLSATSGVSLQFPSLADIAGQTPKKTEDPLLASIFNRMKGAT
jgi:hypothetical protein